MLRAVAAISPDWLIPPGLRRYQGESAGTNELRSIGVEFSGANPFHYLTELLRHFAELKQRPAESIPWNCRDIVARLAKPAAA